MEKSRPLLVFPQAATIPPSKGTGFPSSQPHFPSHKKQVARLYPQLTALQQEFDHYKVNISGSVAGLEPETVLVIEIAGSVNEFRQAVEAIGLEWLGEWDIDDIPPDENFFEKNSKGKPTEKSVKGRMFLSLSNEEGMRKLLSLWEQWRANKTLPAGKTKWRDVFNQMVNIRRWGIEETLGETGMLDRWQDLLDPINPNQPIRCQIELFYRKTENRRAHAERNVATLLEAAGGKTLGSFIDMPEIAFHAVKAEIPAESIRQLLNDLKSESHDTAIQLFNFHGVMYFRPTGQSLAVTEDSDGFDDRFDREISEAVVDLPPTVAILDGVPNVQHDLLKGRLLLDDPDNLSSHYQPGERKHGTSMASLVVHGELDSQSEPLLRQVYVAPVMQPDPHSNPTNRSEHIPDDIFFEDRIARAVRRMFEGEGTVPEQAPDICVINLSLGDLTRPFIHTLSPWARLLDWLSWKYRVLFCVSAGNYTDSIDIGLSVPVFQNLNQEQQVEHVLQCIQKNLSERRILSPAESINAISVGAIHSDSSGNYHVGQRTDLLPGTSSLFSPAARLGYGFRRSIKPEILMPGGRQLYRTPLQNRGTVYALDQSIGKPGQKVAWDSNQIGKSSNIAYTQGTSNATALATRSAARIYEVLDKLHTEDGQGIPKEFISLVIKALLVHGAKQDNNARTAITNALKTAGNSRKIKEVIGRYLGYGPVDIERVLACTEQRATVIGYGKIRENEIHDYRFPLPPALSGSDVWRRMVVTLAWFSPVNSYHKNFREAKLEVVPMGNWNKSHLKLTRQDADHNQVLRGTVQHEIVEGSEKIAAYQDGDNICLHIICKKDATANLDEDIPYGLAVTLEVEEGIQIPIYDQVSVRLRPQVAVGATGDFR